MESLGPFLGRLHPLAVHLPIGILVLVVLWELAALWPRGPRLSAAQRHFLLAIGAVAAAISAGFGWILAAEGQYDETLLARHRLFGLATVGLALALWAAHGLRWRRLYPPLLLATLVVLGAAGHFGGSLTHGEDHLWGAFSTPPQVALDQADVFADVVQPILQQRCVSCHGASKSQGDLRYDSWEELVKGGKHGPALVAGDLSTSLMIQRIHLPLEAKEHMPPKGKPQLTEEEVSLLEWWIESGAPPQKKVVELAPPPEVEEILAKRWGQPPAALPDRAEVLAQAEALARELQLVIRPLSPDEPWLMVNARGRGAAFGDAQLAALAPLAPTLHWLDLGETAVTDAGLAALTPMKPLRRLHLDRTALTDAGLAHLASLTQLEYLNVHGTALTDAGLAALQPLRRLRSLYAWQTGITAAALQAFGDTRVDRRRMQRWEAEIADLQQRIRAEQFNLNLGEAFPENLPEPPKPVPLPMPPLPPKNPPAAGSAK